MTRTACFFFGVSLAPVFLTRPPDRSNSNKSRPNLAHAGDEDNGNVAHAGDEDKENGGRFAETWTSVHARGNLTKIRAALMENTRGQKKVSNEHADLALEKLLKAGRYFEYVPGKRGIDFTMRIHNKAIREIWLKKVRKKSKSPKSWPDSPPTAAQLLRKIIGDGLMNEM